MTPIVLTIDIACPPGDVFAYATNPAHFAEWQHDVTRVQPAARAAGGRVAVHNHSPDRQGPDGQ